MVWRRVLELAWDAYASGCVPIGAVVTDGSGAIVAEARNHLFGEALPGQLSNSRVAHAELNALAQLPGDTGASYADHSVFSNVEPCVLCIGAMLQTGVGAVHYGWADAHAGAATCMTIDNPLVRRRRLRVVGPSDPVVERLTGLLVLSHYVHVRPGLEHVVATFGGSDPAALGLVTTPAVTGALAESAHLGAPLDALLSDLEPWLVGSRTGGDA